MTLFGRIGKEPCMPQNKIQIVLNGNKSAFNLGDSVLAAIEFLNPGSLFVAVEYNGEILEKNDFSKTFLKNGDVLEIIQPLGGGNR